MYIHVGSYLFKVQGGSVTEWFMALYLQSGVPWCGERTVIWIYSW